MNANNNLDHVSEPKRAVQVMSLWKYDQGMLMIMLPW